MQTRFVLTHRECEAPAGRTWGLAIVTLWLSILTSSLADMDYLGSWSAFRLVNSPQSRVYCNCLGPEKLVCEIHWWSVFPVTFTYLFSALHVLDACRKNLCCVSDHKTEQNYTDQNCSVTNMNKVHWMLRVTPQTTQTAVKDLGTWFTFCCPSCYDLNLILVNRLVKHFAFCNNFYYSFGWFDKHRVIKCD